MKKKLIASILSLFVAVGTLFGDIVSTNISNTGHNNLNLISGGAVISSITIHNQAIGTNLVFKLLDSGITNHASGWFETGVSNLAYTNTTTYLTNITFVGTNFNGVTNGMHYTLSNLLYTVSNPVPGQTNLWHQIYHGTVETNSQITLSFPSGLSVGYGLSFTNKAVGGAIAVTVTYEPKL